MGYLDYKMLADLLEQYAESINAAYRLILTLLGQTDWFEKIRTDPILEQPLSVIKATAISLCALFFIIDFLSKTMHLQWVTWENVLMLCVKLVLAKICVDNADWLVSMIYGGFSSAVNSLLGGTTPLEIIPTNDKLTMASYFWLSTEEAQKLYPVPASMGFFDFAPMTISIRMMLMNIIMQILLIICCVIVIGRIFELVVYTVVAPIPLATLACDGLTDIGKSFFKAYAAVCIQAIVLMIMFSSYTLIHGFLGTVAGNLGGWRGLLEIFTLALGVMQSGSWAKRICGAM